MNTNDDDDDPFWQVIFREETRFSVVSRRPVMGWEQMSETTIAETKNMLFRRIDPNESFEKDGWVK